MTKKFSEPAMGWLSRDLRWRRQQFLEYRSSVAGALSFVSIAELSFCFFENFPPGEPSSFMEPCGAQLPANGDPTTWIYSQPSRLPFMMFKMFFFWFRSTFCFLCELKHEAFEKNMSTVSPRTGSQGFPG